MQQGFGTTLLTRLVPLDLSGRATLNHEVGSLRYELEAPFEAIVEPELGAALNVKEIIPTVRVIRGRPETNGLSA